MSYPIPRDGYLTRFLYTGRRETAFSCPLQDQNQLRLEKRMRALAARHEPFTPPAAIAVDTLSPLGQPWKYYYSHGNIFVDDSEFYAELRRVELHAAVLLEAARDTQVTACLWSYCAVDVWLNGTPAARIENPVYKPIQRKIFPLRLRQGQNILYLRLETLGVRDTRTLFALQLQDPPADLRTDLPGAAQCAPYAEAAALLDAAVLEGDTLRFLAPLPQNARLCYFTGERDFYKKEKGLVYADAAGQRVLTLQPYAGFMLELPVGQTVLRRRFERTELAGLVFLDGPVQPGRRELLEKIAAVTSLTRSETDGFALYPMLARRALGQDTAADRAELQITLRQIERRMDCADFMTCALIRLIREYGPPPDVRRVMLAFRYWMDEPGQDGMCFWSENHTLMFFQTAYFFGELYPDDHFPRAGKTGAELRGEARVRLTEWLHDVTTDGFEEFNSSVYSPITFSALLNLVDYAEPPLAKLAWQACDLLLHCMARHCFRGVMFSPMGRVYRGAIAPWRENIQGLVNLADPTAPYVYCEWLAPLATSRYRLPDTLKEEMAWTGAFSYRTGNAVVELYKTRDYLLTSVQSPRRDGVTRVWQPDERPERQAHFCYVKALNEHFHGTSQFEPGVYGYQQHLWYAALDTDLAVFANHPGQSCEAMTEVRPGYWHGNGVFPALRQQDNVLGAVYCIPEDDPIQFVHLFWDTKKFDVCHTVDGWLLGRRGDSYLGVWCSAPLQDHDDRLFGCERRANAPRTGWLVVCGSRREDGGFAAFRARCAAQRVRFDPAAAALQCESFTLRFSARQNHSQIVE